MLVLSVQPRDGPYGGLSTSGKLRRAAGFREISIRVNWCETRNSAMRSAPRAGSPPSGAACRAEELTHQLIRLELTRQLSGGRHARHLVMICRPVSATEGIRCQEEI